MDSLFCCFSDSPGSVIQHKSTHGRKHTLKCYDEGANMPQTVQDLCLSDWKVGYTVDVTFLL